MNANPYRPVLEAYLERKKATGEPLPGIRGRINYKGVVIETGIPARQFRSGCELRLLVDASLAYLTVANKGLYEQPHRFLELEGRVPSMTYAQLKEDGRILLVQQGYAKTSVPSQVSLLNAFQRFLGRTDEDSTIKDFGIHFARHLQSFIKATKRGKTAVSSLRLWAQVHYELHNAKSLPQGFAETLAKLVPQTGRSRRDIARAADLDDLDIVGAWMNGDRWPTDLSLVERVEKVLEVLPGTLTSKLDVSNKSRRSIIPKPWWPERWLKSYASYRHNRDKVLALIPLHVLTGPHDALRPFFEEALQKVIAGEGEPHFRLMIRSYRRKSYRLPFGKWPRPLQEEFADLKDYKTAPTGVDNTERRGRWKERTADAAQGQLESFFGFLCLPADAADPLYRGVGLAPEDLTLAWLADVKAINKFLRFRLQRSGAHSGATETFINVFGSLLQPESGWLWLRPELLDRLPEQQQRMVRDGGTWKDYCVDVHTKLRKLLTSLKRDHEIKRVRNPMGPIEPILNLREPLSAVNHALKLHRADLEVRSQVNKLHSKNQAAGWRDHLLISLLARFPLRAKHWGMFTYNEDGTGYLQNDPNSGWQLVIPYKDFKNVRNKTVFQSEDHDAVLTLRFDKVASPKQLITVLEFYLEHAHPILAANGPYLFPMKTGKAMTALDLFARIQDWTHEYLSQHSSRGRGIKGVHAFGPHAFRAIVAVHLIKKTGSLTQAANLLLDSEETVKRHYSRYLPEDRLARAMAELADVFEDDEEEDD